MKSSFARLAIVCVCFSAFVVLSTSEDVHAQPKKKKESPLAPIQNDPKLPRVLLLGDSISIDYTLPTRKLLAEHANVHRPATNCGPTIRGIEQIDQWLGKEKWDVIHFNWGLHDLKRIDGKHQVPLEDYEKNLNQLVGRLKKTGARLIWCSTTPVPSGKVLPPRSNKDVLAYNRVAWRIMQKNDITIDDLYSYCAPRLKKIQHPHDVHFNQSGSLKLATQVAKSVRHALNKEK